MSSSDLSILRRLADQVAEIANLPVQKQTAQEWKRLNGLSPGRPLISITQIPWHEMNVDDELTPRCVNLFCRQVERSLLTTIYCWKHLRTDMVVEPIYYSPLHVTDTGFGITEDEILLSTDHRNDVCSHDYKSQITCEADIAKIRDPEVTHNQNESEKLHFTLSYIFENIFPVKKRGVMGCWFAPWDLLVKWWGVTEVLTDLIERPELLHMAMDRLVAAYLSMLRQWEDLNVLDVNNGANNIGSGGLGYVEELPKLGFDPNKIRPWDIWGCAAAQIFSSVSPEMHYDFALRYELRWLEKFGLNYYGCCEPLSDKIGILAKIPNLRKISISPWADIARAAQHVGTNYVISYKPNPAIFAASHWNPIQARRDLVSALEQARGCVVEIVMKDISTVRYHPQRLWEWSEIAADVADSIQ